MLTVGRKGGSSKGGDVEADGGEKPLSRAGLHIKARNRGGSQSIPSPPATFV